MKFSSISIFALTLFLASCGGGGSSSGGSTIPAPSNPDSGSAQPTPSNIWEPLDRGVLGISESAVGLSLARYGQDIYFSYNALTPKNIFQTRDGLSFTALVTPSTSTTLLFVDDTGRMFVAGGGMYYSDDGRNFMPLSSLAPRYINGDSQVILGMDPSLRSGFVAGSILKRSLDRGNSWSRVDLDGNAATTDKVLAAQPAFDGANHFIVVDLSAGLWVSQDGGSSWSRRLANDGAFDCAAGNSRFPGLFYAIQRGGVWVTTDSGDTWKHLPPPQVGGAEIIEWIDIVLLDDGELLAWGIPANASNGRGQVFRSDNGGQSWTPIGDPIGVAKDSLIGGGELEDIAGNDQFYFVVFGGRIYKLAR